MKTLSAYIESLGPGELAKIRKKRINDSTRDKKILLAFVRQLEKDLGGLFIISRIDYINMLLRKIRIQFDIYQLFAVDKEGVASFQNRKNGIIFKTRCEALLDKILDHLQDKRFSMQTLEYLPDDDIIALIEDKSYWVD